MGEAGDEDVVAIPPPARNRRGERTRQELIAAAWRVADEMSLVELLAGLTPSVVAGEAGVTTGAFRHHFADTADLVSAMVDQHLGHREPTFVMDADEVRHHEATFDADSLRAGVLGYWQMRARPAQRRRAHRSELLVSRGRQTTMPDGRTLDDRLAEALARSHVELDAPSLDALMERLGREWVAPFDTSTVVRIIEAMCAGLLAQAELQPGVIDDELFADALSAMLLTFSSHSPSAVGLSDFGVAGGVSPSYELHRAHELAIASISVFDRDPNGLTLPQIALETGCQVAELVALFGTVRRMAATSFVAAYPGVVESANRYVLTDPYRALVNALCDIARMARDHPHVARALLEERQAPPDRDEQGETLPIDVRMAVPIGMALVAPLRATGRVPPSDLAVVIGQVVDDTLDVASANPGLSPAEVATRALRRLPDAPVSSSG